MLKVFEELVEICQEELVKQDAKHSSPGASEYLENALQEMAKGKAPSRVVDIPTLFGYCTDINYMNGFLEAFNLVLAFINDKNKETKNNPYAYLTNEERHKVFVSHRNAIIKETVEEYAKEHGINEEHIEEMCYYIDENCYLFDEDDMRTAYREVSGDNDLV